MEDFEAVVSVRSLSSRHLQRYHANIKYAGDYGVYTSLSDVFSLGFVFGHEILVFLIPHIGLSFNSLRTTQLFLEKSGPHWKSGLKHLRLCWSEVAIENGRLESVSELENMAREIRSACPNVDHLIINITLQDTTPVHFTAPWYQALEHFGDHLNGARYLNVIGGDNRGSWEHMLFNPSSAYSDLSAYSDSSIDA